MRENALREQKSKQMSGETIQRKGVMQIAEIIGNQAMAQNIETPCTDYSSGVIQRQLFVGDEQVKWKDGSNSSEIEKAMQFIIDMGEVSIRELEKFIDDKEEIHFVDSNALVAHFRPNQSEPLNPLHYEDKVLASVMIKMTGTRAGDYAEAKRLRGEDQPEGYTWHHVADFNLCDCTCTMVLIPTDIHQEYQHFGAVKQYQDKYNYMGYN